MNQHNERDQSQIDPSQFQNLFDQMQNNHDFLEKMQGILAMYPLTTESDENNSTNTLQKTLTLNRLSSLNEELIRSQTQSTLSQHTQQSVQQQPLMMQTLQRTETLQPTYTKETMEYTPTPNSKQFLQQTPISYQVDSQAKNLFQEQFCNTDFKNMFKQSTINNIQSTQNNFTSPGSETTSQMTPIQSANQGFFQNQIMNNFDPSSPEISPEYFQMFNQFYQMFQQVQAATSIDMTNDPTFMQNMMVQYFTFMMQNGGLGDIEGQAKSPRNFRDYNNLPLAAIPESKDSILEENSGWGTVQTNKLGLLLSNNSGITKEQQQCNCCHNCQEMKKMGVYQQCSNFNIGAYQAFQNSQLNQETFIQKSDISSAANSQILNNPFGLGQISPSPQRLQPIDIQQQYNLAQPLVNQNLNQVFQYNQLLQQQNYSLEPSFNIQSQYDTRKNSYQSSMPELQDYQNQDPYQLNQLLNKNQNQINVIDMVQSQQNKNELSPNNQQSDPNFILFSPRQIQEKKLIEYMIENNDFSNYKLRRQVIKGERISRTMSRSNSKNNTMNWNHQHKLSIVSSSTNNNTQRFSNNFQFSNMNHNQNMYNYYSHNDDNQYTNSQQQQEFFSDIKQVKADNYASNGLIQASDQKTLMFFSPQITNKQQCYVYKSTLEDVVSEDDNQQNQRIPNFNNGLYEQENLASPQNQNTEKGVKKRKKTQDRIQEIRRINEMQRSKEQLKKSVTRKNLHNQPQKSVFEIKDLKKKSQTRKNGHYRKQSQNVMSNKENNKLIQSNYQNNYEMSEQQITLSPVQDAQQESILQEQTNKNVKTFKSLNSVANGKLAGNNNQQHFEYGDNISPQIANLKIKLDNHLKCSASIVPFENVTNLNRIGSQKPSIDLNTLQLQDEPRKPGQEIHIIKKPVQTEEFKRIQERLNRYYQDKRKEEAGIKNDKQLFVQAQKQNHNYYQQNDLEAMSMTKTLSSFKSLMMKTMSQMSMQQENNIAQQFMQGKDQRQRVNSRLKGIANNHNQSVNVSSIQDDQSVGVDYSENLTKIISPKNLYNGKLANIKKRNNNPQEQQVNQQEQIQKQIQQQEPLSNQKQQCLPNVLFFKQQQFAHNKQSSQDTLSLKYNSRPPSLCFCGQSECLCGQDSKKDLLSHFQNFLQEMDKHPQINNQALGIYKDSMFHSPIQNIRQSASTNDFMFTNFHFPNPVRSSSQNSRLNTLKVGHHNPRQSSVSAVSSNNIMGQPRMKRFSSGATLTNLPLKKIQNNLNHCQSTHVFPHLKKISLDSDNQTNEVVIKQIQSIQQNSDDNSNSNSKLTTSTDQLEKLDTNKEEEIRLLNIENDIMAKAFIQKSHRLNLQDSQRNELLQRIQLYKQGQQRQAGKNNSSSTMHEECVYSQGAAGSTQNTSQVTGMGYGSNYNSGNHSIQNHTRRQSDFTNNGTSLEERRKIEKYQKKADIIIQNQMQRQNDIQNHQQQYN